MHPRLRATVLVISTLAALSLSGTAQEALRKGLSPEYDKWLNEDVHWIIGPQERQQFLRLDSDNDRLQFVVNFWEHRNPTPGSAENAFKEEHYRRLAFSNEHFAGKAAGWKSDRGRIYIVYGPPDSISLHEKIAEQVWHYGHLKDIGDVSFTFIDHCHCGEYQLRTEP
jgi:GWxTD domain-containing protein